MLLLSILLLLETIKQSNMEEMLNKVIEKVMKITGHNIVKVEVHYQDDEMTQYEFYVENGGYCLVNYHKSVSTYLRKIDHIWSLGWKKIYMKTTKLS